MADTSYLDKQGVSHLWAKIKALVQGSITGLSASGRTITYTKSSGDTGTITTQDTTYSTFIGASASAYGTDGLVPAPAKGSQEKYLKADGTWDAPAGATYTVFDEGADGLVPGTSTTGDDGTKVLGGKGWSDLGFMMSDVSGGGLSITLHMICDQGVDEDLSGIQIPQASESKQGLLSADDKKKINALESTYAKKTDITNVYRYKGSVANASALPTSGQSVGDVYNIEAASTYGGAGMNVAWDGSAWDALGEIFTVTAMTNDEIDSICV